MKYDLKVMYAGQQFTVTNLEMDDETLVDESTQTGREMNDEGVAEDFFENVMLEVIRLAW